MVEASWTRIVNGESNDGVLVVKYVDVGRRGQLGGGDKRADSCHRHEARQGSPPLIRRRISWAVTTWLQAKTV